MLKENVSVLLIAHNEEAVIARMVEGVLSAYCDKIMEIIVVDDSSTDRTSPIVEAIAKTDKKVRLIRKGPPSGVGYAIKTGFASVGPGAEYVLTMDSDFLDSIGEIRRLFDKIENSEYDGVIGSRFIKGSRIENYPLMKRFMNRAFHMLVHILFGIKQKDLTNNFKLYKTEIVQGLPWMSNGFAINAETGMLPILAGYHIAETPVSWIGRKEDMGKSKFRLFKVGSGYVKVIAYAYSFLRQKKFSGKKS